MQGLASLDQRGHARCYLSVVVFDHSMIINSNVPHLVTTASVVADGLALVSLSRISGEPVMIRVSMVGFGYRLPASRIGRLPSVGT